MMFAGYFETLFKIRPYPKYYPTIVEFKNSGAGSKKADIFK